VTQLARELAELIVSEGPISVERFMSFALSHPPHGYYRWRDPIGARGDFITAPEISQMFGELIGAWAADCWTRMGRPGAINLVELGPGRATLMVDALRALRLMPAFLPAANIHLVETSETLREMQRAALTPLGCDKAMPAYGLPSREGCATASIAWHRTLQDVPDGPLILIANEFFDALPVRQFVRARGSWRERLVGLDEQGALAFGLADAVEPSLRVAAPEGAILEICPQGIALAGEIARRTAAHGGVALLIDYGHVRAGFGDTLQAVRKHAYADPLATPGEADLTAHVDFSALARTAGENGAMVLGPVTQGTFLRALGIEMRATKLRTRATPAQAASVDATLLRLTGDGPGKMGALFKAMAIADPRLGEVAGLTKGRP
jgi:NADH dehydrogenase [ubiquinone] 1 alpha subcomplex assembly factor 7